MTRRVTEEVVPAGAPADAETGCERPFALDADGTVSWMGEVPREGS